MKLKDNEWKWEGYIVIYDKISKRCIYKHRWAMEQKLGRKLNRNEIVHHIDHNKSNNNPDNLELTTISEHNKKHRKWIGKNNPNYNGMAEETKQKLKEAWVKRKQKWGNMGVSNPEKHIEMGRINNKKRWRSG